MITNDFISELEKIGSSSLEEDYENNTWHGFPCDTDGVYEYNLYIKELYIDYFNQVDSLILNLLCNRSDNSFSQFISHITTKIRNIKITEQESDKRARKRIDRISKLEKESIDNNISLGYGRIRRNSQLEYDFLNANINLRELHNAIKAESQDKKSVWNLNIDGIPPRYWCLRVNKIRREYLEKALVRLTELSESYSTINNNQQLSLKNKTQVKTKDFISYLHHDSKDALMEKLHELIDGKRGKLVATIIIALEKLNFIGGYETRAALYNVMRDEFGDIGANAGLNDFITKSYKITDAEINRYIEILTITK